MRALIGLVALASSVNAVAVVTPSGNRYGVVAQPVIFGVAALATISITQNNANGPAASISPPIGAGYINSLNWVVTVGETVSTIVFHFGTNQYSAQIQYRWSPDYPNPATMYPGNNFGATTYTCDMCTVGTAAAPSTAPGTPVSCSTAIGPGGVVTNPPMITVPYTFECANLNRNYIFSGLRQNTPTLSQPSSFSMQIFDENQNPAPNVSSYSFIIERLAPAVIVGDPQIVGMQGQDFQVHGIPDEVFNMITYPTLQVNARFSYLESAECHDNFTACFAHPGTYISEEGFRVGKDKVRVTAGSFKKGLTVTVNGKKTTSNVDLKQGAVEVVNHRRVIVHTSIMKITVSNSDKFLNQELELSDDKLIALGSKRRTLKDNERFHAEVPLHGLQGQTWRNVEYPSGLDYEGSITDYHVVDGNLFGTDFVFNHFDA